MRPNNQYPFGMVIPGRSYGATNYQFGFNGIDEDDEIKGDNNSLDFGERIYDPRLGRFLSIDGLAANYPWYSPFQFAGNKPIWAIDLDGLEEYVKTYLFENGKATFLSTQKNSEVQIEMTASYEKNGQIPFKKIVIDTRTGKPMNPSEIGQVQYQYLNAEGQNLIMRRDINGDYVEGANEMMPLGEDNLFGSIYIGPYNPEVIVAGQSRADYRREPQDEVDDAAMKHDIAYDKVQTAGIRGALSDRTIPADLDIIAAASNVGDKVASGGNDSVTGEKITSNTARRAAKVSKFFKAVVVAKILK